MIKLFFTLLAFMTVLHSSLLGSIDHPYETYKKTSEKAKKQTGGAQFTLVDSIGSRGEDAYLHRNYFSFNLIYGYNGGVLGAEIGLINVNEGPVYGFQVSYVTSFNMQETRGFIVSAGFNFFKKEASGFLVSTMLNLSLQKLQGFVVSSLFNFAKEDMHGLFVTGFGNYTDQANGAFIAGGFNFAKKQNGLMIASLFNINKKGNGLLIAGLMNLSLERQRGLMIAGGFNYSQSKIDGMQIAPMNINVGRLRGFQLGVFNYSQKSSGFQLGVFNIVAEEDGGIPLGLFTVVGHGFFGFDFITNYNQWAALQYKMGVKKLYNIYEVGYSMYGGRPLMTLGLGLGTSIYEVNQHGVFAHIITKSLAYEHEFSGLNLLNEVAIGYRYALTDWLGFIIAPSFNVYVTDQEIKTKNGKVKRGTLEIFYPTYSKDFSDVSVLMWINVNIGLSFTL